MFYNKNELFSLLFYFTLTTAFSAPASATIITSIKPLGFIAVAIADGVVPVEVILPDGITEHSYALRPSDIKRLQEADLVVWVGPYIDSFISKIVNTLPVEKKLELSCLSTIKPLLITSSEKENEYRDDNRNYHNAAHQHYEQYNMHLWMSPEIARQFAIVFHKKLFRLMPNNKEKLDENLQKFKLELRKNDELIMRQLAPIKGKGYFVFHDAYTYFERYYGLISLGYFTVNPEIQPGAQRLHQIRSQLIKQKATCIFTEPQFSPAIIDTVIRGTQVRKGILDPLGMNIGLGKDSYVKFLSQLANQYISCLDGA